MQVEANGKEEGNFIKERNIIIKLYILKSRIIRKFNFF